MQDVYTTHKNACTCNIGNKYMQNIKQPFSSCSVLETVDHKVTFSTQSQFTYI